MKAKRVLVFSVLVVSVIVLALCAGVVVGNCANVYRITHSTTVEIDNGD